MTTLRTGGPPGALSAKRDQAIGRGDRGLPGWSIRVNASRPKLQQSSGTKERISDIAMRWGLLHFGRFAEEHRQLFGERPRDTLAS